MWQIKSQGLMQSWKITKIDQGFLKLERNDFYNQTIDIVDAFGPFSVFIWSCIDPKVHADIKLKYKNNYFPLTGFKGIFIPSFSIVQWQIGPGELQWNGYFTSDQTRSKFNPTKLVSTQLSKGKYYSTILSSIASNPRVYDLSQCSIPTNVVELENFLKIQKPFFELNEVNNRKSSQIANLAKKMVEQKFKSQVSIQDIADRLKVSRTSLSRLFTNQFGLNIEDYKLRLRTFDATSSMMWGQNITRATFDAGFNSTNTFYKKFVDLHKVNPRLHLLKNKN